MRKIGNVLEIYLGRMEVGLVSRSDKLHKLPAPRSIGFLGVLGIASSSIRAIPLFFELDLINRLGSVTINAKSGVICCILPP